MNYISLFSASGIGCYGFKEQGYNCIATNEFLSKRLEIQKYNNKCKFDSGYIQGDIFQQEIKDKIFNEIKKHNVNDIDILIATPPCQGMSDANHNKKDKDIKRNSLVVESIKMILLIKPKVFGFENVKAF